MKKIILNIVLLVILSAAVFTKDSGLQAQTFKEVRLDSVTSLAGRYTWKKLPTGVNSIEVAADSCDLLQVAFTGAGKRTEQRKDSLNYKRVFRGQTRFFNDRDNDSIGFKGAGKIYFWIDRGAGNPGTFNNAQGSDASPAFNPATDNNFSVLQTIAGINNTGAVKQSNIVLISPLLGDTTINLDGTYRIIHLKANPAGALFSVVEFNLPPVASAPYVEYIFMIAQSGDISATVTTNGSELINGNTDVLNISTPLKKYTIYNDGTSWFYTYQIAE